VGIFKLAGSIDLPSTRLSSGTISIITHFLRHYQLWLEPRFRQAIYAPHAVMANAAGFLRYGLRQWDGR
jgi:hypothetical protein